MRSIWWLNEDCRFINPRNLVCIIQQDKWRNGYRCLVEKCFYVKSSDGCVDMAMRNGHIIFIIYIHRNLEIRKLRNDFFVQVRNFLLPLSLKVLLWERVTIFLFWLFHLNQHVWHPPQRSQRTSESQPSFPEADIISTHWRFKNFPKSSTHFLCVTSFALASLRFPSRAIVTSLSDTSALLRARAWKTCVNVAPK